MRARRDAWRRLPTRGLPDVLSRGQLDRSVAAIAAVQQNDGMIPWSRGRHTDPWNHVEAAMALDAGGRPDAARAAYRWLASTQRPDGAWHQYYLAGRVLEPTLDANVSAYVATGVWHHHLATGDVRFLASMWPVVERAMGFVLDLQTPRGEIAWARGADGAPASYALLTASCSTYLSLRCAIASAHRLGAERPDWEFAAVSLASVIRSRPDAFVDKDRWAMDWYYPVLAGVLRGDRGRERLECGRATFVMEGLGTRCVSDQPWVTAAETSECAMAHVASGDEDTARQLLLWAQHLRSRDGNYFTGMVHPQEVHFPASEQTTYSAAAVVLAADSLRDARPTARLLRGDGLPPAIALEPVDAATIGRPAQ